MVFTSKFQSRNRVIWTIKELAELMRQRQLNKFDCNIGVSGKRGDGKSTLLFKILQSFRKEGFKPKKHQVYSRDEVIQLLSTQQFGFCWDDEAINSGYKRDFQNKGQQDLIKIITNYRDSFNIYASALPFFYSLDKDLRELIFIHLHVVKRGLAVVLMPVRNSIHGTDPWDSKVNSRVEEKENKRLSKNPKARFRYSKLTTFAGFLYFGDMTAKQRRQYEEIKKTKRAKVFKSFAEKEIKEMTFEEKVFNRLKDGKLTKEELQAACLIQGKRYRIVSVRLGEMLRDNGFKKTLGQMFYNEKEENSKEVGNKINEVIPVVT